MTGILIIVKMVITHQSRLFLLMQQITRNLICSSILDAGVGMVPNLVFG